MITLLLIVALAAPLVPPGFVLADCPSPPSSPFPCATPWQDHHVELVRVGDKIIETHVRDCDVDLRDFAYFQAGPVSKAGPGFNWVYHGEQLGSLALWRARRAREFLGAMLGPAETTCRRVESVTWQD